MSDLGVDVHDAAGQGVWVLWARHPLAYEQQASRSGSTISGWPTAMRACASNSRGRDLTRARVLLAQGDLAAAASFAQENGLAWPGPG